MSDVTERIKERFIIIYDEFTRPMALSLRNSIEKANETCVVWTEDVYNRNEYKLTNRNLLVILNEKMIKDHLANPTIKSINFSEGVILKHEGNTVGIMLDSETDFMAVVEKRKIIPWFKIYGWSFFPGIGTGITLWQEAKAETKIKRLLLFEAVEKLKAETIEKFLNGEELD